MNDKLYYLNNYLSTKFTINVKKSSNGNFIYWLNYNKDLNITHLLWELLRSIFVFLCKYSNSMISKIGLLKNDLRKTTTRKKLKFLPRIRNYIDYNVKYRKTKMTEVLATRNNLTVKNSDSHLKEKIFTCLGQGHTKKRNKHRIHNKGCLTQGLLY